MARSTIKSRHISPNVYVVAGPNGAGKSTFALKFLPEYAKCKEFVNADLIAAGLSPLDPSSAALQAGRLMLDRIQSLSAQGVDFGFETTLSGRRHERLLQGLRATGYRVHLFYLWLPSAELAVSRVEKRARLGGHHVPEETVRRRFERSLRAFDRVARNIADAWLVFDNSRLTPQLVAYGNPRRRHVVDARVFARISQQ